MGKVHLDVFKTIENAKQQNAKVNSYLSKLIEENKQQSKTIESLKMKNKSLKSQREKARRELYEVCYRQSKAIKELQASNTAAINLREEITENMSSEEG